MLTIRVDEQTELRLLQLHHADEVYAVMDANRRFLAEWLPWVDAATSSNDTMTFIAGELEKYANGTGFTCGIWVGGQLAGTVGLNSIERIHRKAEIGYWLAQSFTGRGTMTRSCAALIGYAFSSLRLHRIEIRAAAGNIKSRAIPERLGFRLEGVLRDAEKIGDRFVDHCVYGLLEHEWNAGGGRT